MQLTRSKSCGDETTAIAGAYMLYVHVHCNFNCLVCALDSHSARSSFRLRKCGVYRAIPVEVHVDVTGAFWVQ